MPIDTMTQNHENPLTYEEWSCQYPEYSAALLQSERNSADILELACDLIQAEVTAYCGQPRKREGRKYQRWGNNPGSICLDEARVKISVPRVRNQETNKEQPLRTYQHLHKRRDAFLEKLINRLLLGLSQRSYHETAAEAAESFGLSASSVGRRFVAETAKTLEAFMNRRFDDQTFIAISLDGKTLRGRQMILCLGITVTGEKLILGFTESNTENHESVRTLLLDLIQRGFRHIGHLLVLIDGAKGLRKGIQDVFGAHALVQRCQWHKRENVTRHIKDDAGKKQVKAEMEEAYAQPTYAQAKRALVKIEEELEQESPSAAASLREGMEETLTLHKLGVADPLRNSLRTTNTMENVNSLLAHGTRNVKRWSNSHQRQRWIAAVCLHAEKRLKRIPNNPQLRALVHRLKHYREPVNRYLETSRHAPLTN